MKNIPVHLKVLYVLTFLLTNFGAAAVVGRLLDWFVLPTFILFIGMWTLSVFATKVWNDMEKQINEEAEGKRRREEKEAREKIEWEARYGANYGARRAQ